MQFHEFTGRSCAGGWSLTALLAAALSGLVLAVDANAQSAAGESSNPRFYRRGGFSSMISMGRTLFKVLPDPFKGQVHFQPVTMEPDPVPFIRAIEVLDPDVPNPIRLVTVSSGFADLMNFVAHAKAVDQFKRGFFQTYVAMLAQQTGRQPLPELPGLNQPEFWTDDVLNEQESNFNQMTGILIAVELSHHYLGHYRKYEKRLKDAAGQFVPINTLLTSDEWDLALKAGTLNALECGFGVEGVLALFEAIEKMPQRPAWTLDFAPPVFKFSKIRRDLRRYEENFFAGAKQSIR